VHADLLLLLSDVDGLYDAPPDVASSRLIPDVTDAGQLDGIRIGRAGASGVGTGGMQTKLEAARIATGAGIPVVLTDMAHARQALAGEETGTHFHPTGRRRPTRLLWLAHATEPKGRVVLDDGAVRAVTERRASLLPAGITGVAGAFVAGDPVDLVDERGLVLARGLVNYDASELPGLLGRSTRDLARELGAAYEREVVHRDDLIVL
jgi:glutamate 5-kinase